MNNSNNSNNSNKKTNNNNIDLLKLFMPLMSKTLHLLGQDLDIETIKNKIYQLVEQTQIQLKLTIFDNYKIQIQNSSNSNSNSNDISNNKNIQLIKNAQFAVYAWIDEKILTSDLADALQWSNCSLQNTYFNTSEAGYLFYKNLDDILTNFFDLSNTNITDLITKGSDYDYDYNYNYNYHYHLMINEKLAKFATQLSTLDNLYSDSADDYYHTLFNTIKIYSLCILYGFIGIYHNDENTLKSLRNNAYYILHNNSEVNKSDFDYLIQHQEQNIKNYAADFKENIIQKKHIELFLYIIIPLIFCVIFTIFSADLLLQSPFDI